MTAQEKTINNFTFYEGFGERLSYQQTISRFFKDPFVLGFNLNDSNRVERRNVLSNFEVDLTNAAAKIKYYVTDHDSDYRFAFFDALRVAHANHYRLRQTRTWEYNGACFEVDYILHPLAVALKLFDLLKNRKDLSPENLDTLMCASVLHDVVEDTVAPEYYDQAYACMCCFHENNPHISRLVKELTDIPSVKSYELSDQPIPEGTVLYNRNQRKIINIERLRVASLCGQVIKLVDIWHNTTMMHLLDPGFQEIYRKEIAQTFSVLTKPNFDDVFGIVYDNTKEMLQKHNIEVNHVL